MLVLCKTPTDREELLLIIKCDGPVAVIGLIYMKIKITIQGLEMV